MLVNTAIADVTHPGQIRHPVPWAAFASGNHPVDAGQVEARQRAKQRLQRQEPSLNEGRVTEDKQSPGAIVR